MTRPRPSDLELAERHVAEAEIRVTRQEQIISEMERHKHFGVAARGRDILATFNATLELLRAHLAVLRRHATRP
jgi:hypothetical protein